jgi:hypothetical protein
VISAASVHINESKVGRHDLPPGGTGGTPLITVEGRAAAIAATRKARARRRGRSRLWSPRRRLQWRLRPLRLRLRLRLLRRRLRRLWWCLIKDAPQLALCLLEIRLVSRGPLLLRERWEDAVRVTPVLQHLQLEHLTPRE